MDALKVLVTGSTGQQGSRVARLLLEHGHRVRAFTRKPGSAPAEALQSKGAEIVAGSYEDRDSLERAMRGADAVFAVATPYESGPEDEERGAKAIVDAAKKVGIGHLLYSSVSDCDRDTGIPHFESKARVEEHIRSLNVPHTIVAPVFFFENFLSPWIMPGLKRGVLAQPMPANRPLQMIALENVAAFSVLVLENRERFLGRRINIASDELPMIECARLIAELSGKQIEYQEIPLEQARESSADSARMYEWFTDTGYSVDIPQLRAEYPQIGWQRFEEWARGQDWRQLLAG